MLLVGLTGRSSPDSSIQSFLQKRVISDGSLDLVPSLPGRPKNYLQAFPMFVVGFLLPTTHFYMHVSAEQKNTNHWPYVLTYLPPSSPSQ